MRRSRPSASARARSASPRAARGAVRRSIVRGSQSSAGGSIGSGSGVGSSSTMPMPIAARPSTSAWCIFGITAVRPSSRPSIDVQLPQRPRAVQPPRHLARHVGRRARRPPRRQRAERRCQCTSKCSSSTQTGCRRAPKRRLVDPLAVARDEVQPRGDRARRSPPRWSPAPASKTSAPATAMLTGPRSACSESGRRRKAGRSRGWHRIAGMTEAALLLALAAAAVHAAWNLLLAREEDAAGGDLGRASRGRAVRWRPFSVAFWDVEQRGAAVRGRLGGRRSSPTWRLLAVAYRPSRVVGGVPDRPRLGPGDRAAGQPACSSAAPPPRSACSSWRRESRWCTAARRSALPDRPRHRRDHRHLHAARRARARARRARPVPAAHARPCGAAPPAVRATEVQPAPRDRSPASGWSAATCSSSPRWRPAPARTSPGSPRSARSAIVIAVALRRARVPARAGHPPALAGAPRWSSRASR